MSLRDRAKGISMDEILDETDVKVSEALGQYLRIPKDSIYSNQQVRKKFDPQTIKELGISLEINGQEQPIVVYPLDSKGYLIQKGERRWRAAMSNSKVTHLDCVVRERGDILGQITENIQREDLNPIDLGNALKKAKQEYDFNNRELAAKLGKTESYISKYLNVTKSPIFILDAFENGIVGDVETINELRKAAEVDELETKKFVDTNKIVTRSDSINFKKSLGSTEPKVKDNTARVSTDKRKKTPKQEVTSIVVQVDNRQGLVFASGKYADKLTILFDDGDLEQIAIESVKLVGYRL